MGKNWVKVRNDARAGTIRASDDGVREVVSRWQQFVEYLCLGLSQDLGVQVASTQSRSRDGDLWSEALLSRLCDDGVLGGSFRVPGAVGPIEVHADLRAQLTRTSIRITGPKEGRPLTRINWLLRQLSNAPDDLRIEVQFARTKETTAMRLADARDDPKALLSAADPKRDPRSFDLSLAGPLGTKRGRGERSFVAETRRQVVSFYAGLVEDLRGWQPKAPRLQPPDHGTDGDPRRTIPPSTGDDLVAVNVPEPIEPADSPESSPLIN